MAGQVGCVRRSVSPGTRSRMRTSQLPSSTRVGPVDSEPRSSRTLERPVTSRAFRDRITIPLLQGFSFQFASEFATARDKDRRTHRSRQRDSARSTGQHADVPPAITSRARPRVGARVRARLTSRDGGDAKRASNSSRAIARQRSERGSRIRQQRLRRRRRGSGLALIRPPARCCAAIGMALRAPSGRRVRQ